MRTVSFRDIPAISGINVKRVEEKYNAIYMGDSQLKTKSGDWGYQPAAFFWQEKPPVEGYSNYMAIFVQEDKLFITTGAAIADYTIDAVESGGEIIYSRYRHDYRELKNGGGFIDGGRDYTRIGGDNYQLVRLRALGPVFEVLE